MEELTILASISTTTGFLGIVANIAQLILMFRDNRQKKSAFGLTILSLNIADLFASMGFFLLGAIRFTFVFKVIDLALFRSLVKTVYASLAFSLTSSFTHVAFIAIQRVLAVAFPFKVKRIITKSRCYISLAVMWFISVALAFVLVFHLKLVFKLISCISIVVGVALIAIYSVVCYKTMKRSMVHNFSENAQRRRHQTEKGVLMYSVAITCVFIICNYPKGLNQFIRYPTFVYITSNSILSVNPLLDTMLYFMASYCRRKTSREGSYNTSTRIEKAASIKTTKL